MRERDRNLFISFPDKQKHQQIKKNTHRTGNTNVNLEKKILRLILSNWKTQGCAERTHVFGSLAAETLGVFEDPNDMPKTMFSRT